ncbi:MAG: DNA-processing protein DprA [Candidatus Moranbacteria bacterium]|nr:DNA-processing protein DprA [Candidatus Moranbacteria bacterium]
MRDNELIYWNAFAGVGGFGPQSFKKLLAFFGDLETAWKAGREELIGTGIGEKKVENLLSERGKISPEKFFEDVLKEQIEIITINSAVYSPRLKEIPSAPAVLYGRGDLKILNNKSLAVVGSRKFTSYGERSTQSLCRDLVRAGLTITSGLALGIDAIAHRATLEAGGKTIAVLGTGIDDATIYPRENFNLAKNIIESGGALLTEYPPKTPSLKQNFPARNRIMAGLSLGTLVIEAAEGSGSLITAGYALEFDREVLAVPGDIFSPQSTGANALIKNGAKLVQSANDILEELNVKTSGRQTLLFEEQKNYDPKTSEEKILWKILSHEPLHIDRISKMTKLDAAAVNGTLSLMEVEGAVKNVGGQNYIKL